MGMGAEGLKADAPSEKQKIDFEPKSNQLVIRCGIPGCSSDGKERLLNHIMAKQTSLDLPACKSQVLRTCHHSSVSMSVRACGPQSKNGNKIAMGT